MNNRKLPVVAVLLTFLLCSCATWSSRQISVSLADVEAVNASVFETGVALTVRIANESETPLALRGSVHRLYVNGVFVGRGLSDEALEVAPFSTAKQRVPLYVENLSMLGKIRMWAAGSKIEYRLESRLHPVTGSGVHAESTGELDWRMFTQAVEHLR